MSRKLGFPLLALLLLAAAIAIPGTAQAAKQPNLIVITTDDQTLEAMNEETMPFTANFFANRGTEFSNAVVVSPSCCPARAAYISGQYTHNNGVANNFPGYPDLRNKRTTLPTWLDNAGYNTAHIGKFLNRYGSVNGWSTPAPGFDRWFTLLTYKYYDYKIANAKKVRSFGHRDRDYLTRRFNRKAVQFLSRATRRKDPVYLQLDQFAPHSETGSTPGPCPEAAQPDPKDLNLFADAPLPQDDLPPEQRSFNEEDTSDKSPVMAGMRRLSDFVISKVQRRYRCQLAALREVDRGVQQIQETLNETRSLRNTAIVFTSDNGFFHGEHRLPNNKGFPYEEGIRVPLLISLPRSMQDLQPEALDQPVSNIDITASLLELAGAEPCNRAGLCRQIDGRSLVGLLTGSDPDFPADRRIVIQQDRPQFLCAPYSALWQPSRILIEYPTKEADGSCTPESEYYEMDSDPLQLENLYPAEDGTERAREQRKAAESLHKLLRCSGIEGRDQKAGGRPFCE